MPAVPHRSQDIVGTAPLRDAIVFNAHANYYVDGDTLNKLAVLACRLDMHPGSAIPLDTDERREWATIITYAIADAQSRGPL